jgi:cytoskeleton protein RodZ
MTSPQTEQTETSGNKPVPGVRLKAAREARGLSLDEVANVLKLDLDKIEALEHDELGHIAAPVYAAGYLRAYAKLLNLPADEIVAEFEALTRMESPVIDPTNSPAGQDFGKVDSDVSLGSFLAAIPGWLWFSALALILLGGVYQTWFGGDSNGMSGAMPLTDTSDAASDTPMLAPMSAPEPSSATDTERPADSGAPRLGSVDDEPATAAAGEVATETSGGNAAPQPSAPQQSELVLYFNDDSWVEVNDARGQRLLYRLAKAGMAQTLQGVAPFEVQLGYVPGVDIMYNGKPFDLSRYQGRRSARFRVGTASDSMANSQ